MINTFFESELHKSIKILYAHAENGQMEVEVEGKICDVVTNKRIKEILADEQEHLQALKDLVADVESTINKCNPIPSCTQVNCEEPCSGCDDPSAPVINPNIDAVG